MRYREKKNKKRIISYVQRIEAYKKLIFITATYIQRIIPYVLKIVTYMLIKDMSDNPRLWLLLRTHAAHILACVQALSRGPHPRNPAARELARRLHIFHCLLLTLDLTFEMI